MTIQVNGKKVDSDKNVLSVVGTRINFHDGSWCDVSTNQVVNKGSGYITIGAEGVSGAVITNGPHSFRSQSLELHNVNADIDVRIHSEDSIKVTVVGPEGDVKKIRIKEKRDHLRIEGDTEGGGGNNVISIGGGRGNVVMSGLNSGTIITGSNITIGGGSVKSDVKITVYLPEGKSVKVKGVEGNTVIGDINADLVVDVTSRGDIRAGQVKNVALSISGHGKIDIASVQGGASIQVMGHGNVKVKAGNMPSVNVNVMGHGNVDIKGTAETANLTVMGHGNIYAQNVKTKPNTNIMGHGSINVGNW